MLGDQRFDVTLETQGEALIVRFADGDSARIAFRRIGVRANLSSRATSTARTVYVQARPILNGYELSHQGVSVAARVYTQREAELVALYAEEEERRRLQASAVPDAGPRQDDRRRRKARRSRPARRCAWSRP